MGIDNSHVIFVVITSNYLAEAAGGGPRVRVPLRQTAHKTGATACRVGVRCGAAVWAMASAGGGWGRPLYLTVMYDKRK